MLVPQRVPTTTIALQVLGEGGDDSACIDVLLTYEQIKDGMAAHDSSNEAPAHEQEAHPHVPRLRSDLSLHDATRDFDKHTADDEQGLQNIVCAGGRLKA